MSRDPRQTPPTKKPKFEERKLGPMPVAAINKAFNLDLEPGDVMFSRAAQAHAYKRHKDDFEKCTPHMGGIVCNPLYIGDDFKNPGKVELISRVASLGMDAILVAISVEMDTNGQYNVCSVYPIDNKKIKGRRAKGTLKNV